MFTEELDVSKVYSLASGEILNTHARMWAVCTSVASDNYDDIFTPEATLKMQNVLSFEFLSEDRIVPKSKTKFIDIWYNDEIEKIAVSTHLNLVHLIDKSEWYNISAKFDPVVDFRERLLETFMLNAANEIVCEGFIIDPNGVTTGMQSDIGDFPKVKDTQLGRTIDQLREQTHQVLIDWYKNSTDITLNVKRDYSTRVMSFPNDPNTEYDRMLRWEFNKDRVAKRKLVEDYLTLVRDRYQLISDEQRTWILSLLDHPEQEIDLSYVFTSAGELKDVLVYKREAKRFEIWR